MSGTTYSGTKLTQDLKSLSRWESESLIFVGAHKNMMTVILNYNGNDTTRAIIEEYDETEMNKFRGYNVEACSYLLSTIHPDTLPLIKFKMEKYQAAWAKQDLGEFIEFVTGVIVDRAKLTKQDITLRNAFHEINMGSQNLMDYYSVCYSIVEVFEMYFDRFADEYIIDRFINGLSADYDYIKENIKNHYQFGEVEDLEGLVVLIEKMMANKPRVSVVKPAAATATATQVSTETPTPATASNPSITINNTVPQVPKIAMIAEDQNGRDKKNVTCFNCNKKGHYANECRIEKPSGPVCFNCGTPGHIKSECRKRPKGNSGSNPNGNKKKKFTPASKNKGKRGGKDKKRTGRS